MKIRLPKMKLKILIPTAIIMYGGVAAAVIFTIKNTGWHTNINSILVLVFSFLFTGFMAGVITWMGSHEEVSDARTY